jgi:hypothetical protein
VIPTATGLTYSVSVIPVQGMQIVLTSPGFPDVCRVLSSRSGTIPWGSFVPNCWEANPDGGVFTASYGITSIRFHVPADTTARPWNFCVDSVSF